MSTLRLMMSGEMLLDGQPTGLHLSQGRTGTVVYSPSRPGRPYRQHPMPATHYSTVGDLTRPGVAGVTQLEADVRALLAHLGDVNAPA